MAIDWKSSEALEDLLVAFYVVGVKPDWKKVAVVYGKGATYHSVEGFMRKIRQRAEARKQQMTEDMGQEASAFFGTPVKDVTPRTPTRPRTLEGTTPCRVQKTKTQPKRAKASKAGGVKAEDNQSSAFSSTNIPILPNRNSGVSSAASMMSFSGTANSPGDISFEDEFSASFDLGPRASEHLRMPDFVADSF